jgi:hypothetical protein
VGGVLSTLVDLAPGELYVTKLREGESLAEAYEAQETRDNTRVEAGSLAFRLKHKELDLFTAASPNWLRTRGGVLFIPLKGGFVVLWPSRDGEPDHWDVWGVPEGPGKSVPLQRNADWRRQKVSPRMLAVARSMRLDVGPGDRAGQVSDQMAIAQASRKLDHLLKGLGQ